MVKLKLTTAYSLQIGTTPTDIVTFAGEEGDTLDVPSDAADMMIAAGAAVLVESEKPATPKPKKAAGK